MCAIKEEKYACPPSGLVGAAFVTFAQYHVVICLVALKNLVH